MHLSRRPLHFVLLLLLSATNICAAASWGFTDATVSVQGKGTGVGGGFKERLVERKPLSKAVELGAVDTLKIILTTQDGKTAKRPHQAFLLLRDADTGLDISYPFNVKDSGKAKIDLVGATVQYCYRCRKRVTDCHKTQKDLPTQFLKSTKPIDASLVLGSFGQSKGYNDQAFSLSIALDPNAPIASSEKPLRYGRLPEIHHIFKSDPKSPNILITLVFTGAVLATLPMLLGTWLYLGGNLNHLSKAMQDAPVSHATFYGSVVCIEGIFFMYYTSWNLFKTLPTLLLVGTIAFLSGSRALTEVQERRLARLR